MQYSICILGLNHKTAPIEARERFDLTGFSNRDLDLLGRESPVREMCILSTCNRIEILAVGEEPALSRLLVRNWAHCCQRDSGELEKLTYSFHGLDAVEHLFMVSSSLDSMVVGEPQILGQLKEAYKKATQEGTTGVVINRLMHKAFSVAKRVRSETRIAQNAVSISYAAVELAREIFSDLKNQRAMLIGAGEMAELAASHLLRSGLGSLVITNRTFSRAQELARSFNAAPVPFEQLSDQLTQVDIVISSTGSREAILHESEMKRILRARKYRPMFFIDIAVPRDIDPDINRQDNVYLYDIDDLGSVVEENLMKRLDEADLAHSLVSEEVRGFQAWLKSLDLTPTIKDLVQQGSDLAEKEVQKSLKGLGHREVSPEVRQAMRTLAHSVSKKLLHHPISFLKRKAEQEESSRYSISLARRMFNLDRDAPQGNQDPHSSQEEE
ncbi:MAG: glutamyl-tRNA reductase [Desulfohalobiaceae bacterium]|nr:glutamyl-tRNA reductase [Desulfohalobiaceae bacterium]